MIETLDIDVSGEFDELIKANVPFALDDPMSGQNPEDLQVDNLTSESLQESTASEGVAEGNVIPFGVNIGKKVTELMMNDGVPDNEIRSKYTEYLSIYKGKPQTDSRNDDKG